MADLGNTSVIGRLLEALSWEAGASGLPGGGQGRENVLTAGVLLPHGYLSRARFLGQVVQSAHGAEAARARLVDEIEDTAITLLPDQRHVGTDRVVVQPDAVLVSPGCHVLVEAKRIRGSSFQPEQLSREYLALTGDAADRSPLLLLLLGTPPPVRITGGPLGVVEAVRLHLRSVHERTGMQTAVEEVEAAVPERAAWITWDEIRQVVVDQLSAMPTLSRRCRAPSIGSHDR